MNPLAWLLIALLVVRGVDSLVWSLVLGNPVIDAQDDDSSSQEKDSGIDAVRSATNRRLPSRPTRHHHGQDKCIEDRVCGKGRFCDLHYGVCRAEKSPGFACRRDRMCAKGLHCMYGRCQAKIAAGEEGSRCHGSSDCQPGLCCARRHGESVCQRKLTLGQRCYVPDGGLEYSLNQLCPCEVGLVCAQLTPQGEHAVDAAHHQNSTESETFPFWTSTENLRCQTADENHA